MKLLLLLTSSFPYGKGEEFLSQEIRAVSGFDRVLVCPCGRAPNSVQTKCLPAGAECVPVCGTGSRRDYFRVLFLPGVLKELFSIMGSGRFVPGRIHEMLFFMKHALQIFRSLKQKEKIGPRDEATIYSYWFYDSTTAGALLKRYLKKRVKSVHLISRAHGFDIHRERAVYHYLPMRRFLFQNIDTVYPCSENGADTLRREYPEFSNKIQVSYLGTQDHGMKPGERGEFHLVSCSYLVEVKRIHLIIETLKEANFPVHWTHIGSGPLEENIRALAKNLPDCVKAEFLGALPNDDVLDYYRSQEISVFLNVSSSEGIPVSVMEACSFGLPVVATDVGGTREIVEDGINGFLLPGDFSSKMLLDRLDRLRTMNLPDYMALCENSRLIWNRKFNAEKNYQKFYKELCS